MKSRSEAGKRRDRIAILQRRMDYLQSCINTKENDTNMHYWRAESAALRWAIGLCQEDHERLERLRNRG